MLQLDARSSLKSPRPNACFANAPSESMSPAAKDRLSSSRQPAASDGPMFVATTVTTSQLSWFLGFALLAIEFCGGFNKYWRSCRNYMANY